MTKTITLVKQLITVLFLITTISTFSQKIEIQGNGIEITNGDTTPSTNDSTDFGGIALSPNTKTVTFTIISAQSGKTLNVSDISVSGSAFTLSPDPFTASIPGGSSATFDITFETSIIGTSTADITIASSAKGGSSSYTFRVSGSGPSPEIDVLGNNNSIVDGNTSPSLTNNTDFGNTTSGGSIVKEYTVRNTGSEDLIITTPITLATGSYFSVTTQPALTTLTTSGANQSTTFQVTFTPPSDGVFIDELIIQNNDIDKTPFNFSIQGAILPPVIRGPYLQTGTSTSVIVKWRTSMTTDTKVNYGINLGSLNSTVSDPTLTTEHEITLTGLTPNTTYYYELADTDGVYLAEDAAMFVKTAPIIATKQFVRAWVLGDAGTSGSDSYGDDQEQVRDAYYNYVANASQSPNQTDMMLFLGDNAYNSGTDNEYQKGFFNIYDEMLKKSVAWSTLGNHDGYSASSSSQTGPYYDIFSFPTNGEAGGTASGTEAYYSFDYANIHFIVLESYRLYNDATQMSWVTSDIANTNQDWIVAIFHHPPYTKGSHNSDTETELVAMRENFLPILEAGGVDLILSGHSHSYERSKFIKGRTGSNNNDALDSGQPGAGVTIGANGNLSGRDDTADGAYEKTILPEGAVYITTGSAGKATSGSIDHAAMYYSVLDIGSTILEVEDDGAGGQNMNVKFLSDDNHDYNFAINDYFTIHKSSSVINVLATDSNVLNKAAITVYPVPANDILNIRLSNDEKLQSVKFYNAFGSLVKESKKKDINVRSLRTGVYLLEITSEKNTYYKSIIVE